MTGVDRLGHAYEAYRRTASTRSAIVLLLANAIPLIGVLFFDWSLLTILVLYWLENGIVGLWNIPKIVLAQGSIVPRRPDPAPAAAPATARAAAAPSAQTTPAGAAPPAAAPAAAAPSAPATAAGTAQPPVGQPGFPPRSRASQFLGPRAAARLASIPRAVLAMFFAVHYGTFWFVHGIFVFLLPAFAGGAAQDGACFDATTGFPIDCGTGAFGELVWPSVVIGGVALFLSHGVSFFLNYLGRGEYLTASPGGQMGSVYGRVVVLHLTIIIGSFVVAFLGAPVGALLVLVVLKTAFDLNLHLRERRRAGQLLTAASPSDPA